MASGYEQSPASGGSQSDGSPDHPVDEVIQRAISRQQSPALRPREHPISGKRKRERLTHDAESASPPSSPDISPRRAIKPRKTSGLSPASTPALAVAPVGVTVVEDGSETQNAAVRPLLRGSRYFDDNVEELGPACYNCGQRGHKAYQCQNPKKETPCALCAQYGHNKANCPSLLCYKCKKRGHIARECPNPKPALDGPSHICLRCGKADCAAAGREDYHRAEGGCTESYSRADLALVRCYICNRMGHLCCAKGPEEAPAASCHNCGDAGHRASDCHIAKPTQVTMERQYDDYRSRRHNRFSADHSRPQSAGAYDRWSTGNSYSSYNGARMATGNGYASRVNAFASNSRGGYSDYHTPDNMQSAHRGTGNRFYPGSEKIHGRQLGAYDSPYNGYDSRHGATESTRHTAPFDRWRR